MKHRLESLPATVLAVGLGGGLAKSRARFLLGPESATVGRLEGSFCIKLSNVPLVLKPTSGADDEYCQLSRNEIKCEIVTGSLDRRAASQIRAPVVFHVAEQTATTV